MGSNFGYDVLVYVGTALFLRHRCSREVIQELAACNVDISPSEVNYLGRKFIVYLAIAHRQSTPRIKEAMRAKGGYILHLDGTCEGPGPILVSGLDALSAMLLASVKLPSEKADSIIPFLEEIKQRFGEPVASVHDMGPGISKAVATVFPDKPDFICHFHFLRDVGKDLLEPDYDSVRKQLRKHGIGARLQALARKLKKTLDEHPGLIDVFRTYVEGRPASARYIGLIPAISAYSLILWALAGKHQGDGYGFPFDRPHVVLAQRLLSVHAQVQVIKKMELRGRWKDNRPLYKLSLALDTLASDKTLRRILGELQPKIKIFDELRDAMRVAPMGGTQGLNHDAVDDDIGTIETNVRAFHQRLKSDAAYADNRAYRPMIDQIEKYWQKLFADPILVDTPEGKVPIQPQRTNNLMERFFRDIRSDNRRRTGHNAMSRRLQTMLAETPLVKNLQNETYMHILLDGSPSLEDRFAQIDTTCVRERLLASATSATTIPATIKKMISKPAFPQVLAQVFCDAPLAQTG